MKQPKLKPMTLPEVKAELAETARIGTVFMDGDLCHKMLRPYAVNFLDGDDFDLDPEGCVPIKKTLIRIERVSRVRCVTAVWRRRPDVPDCGEPLLFGSYSAVEGPSKISARYKPGAMFPALRRALADGKPGWKITRCSQPILVTRGFAQPVSDGSEGRVVACFVPIRDSMGDIAAALEVYAYLVSPDAVV